MQVKVTLQVEGLAELQTLNAAVQLYAQHIKDGEIIPIIGTNPHQALELAYSVLGAIAMLPTRGMGEYEAVTQVSFLGNDRDDLR